MSNIAIASQTIDFHGPVTSTGPGWVCRDGGTVTVAGREFRVEVQTFTSLERDPRRLQGEVRLIGPRGGVYFLRPFLGNDTGKHQVIEYSTGKPWRHLGHEVRATLIGDVLTPEYLR